MFVSIFGIIFTVETSVPRQGKKSNLNYSLFAVLHRIVRRVVGPFSAV